MLAWQETWVVVLADADGAEAPAETLINIGLRDIGL